MEARGGAEMSVMQEGPLRAAGAHDQAHEGAGDRALRLAASGRGAVERVAHGQFTANVPLLGLRVSRHRA
jgi:hypothetical protein